MENYIKTLDGNLLESKVKCKDCDKYKDANIFNPNGSLYFGEDVKNIKCPMCKDGSLYTKNNFKPK